MVLSMSRRKKVSVPDVPRPDRNWIVLTEIQINGRHVVKGTELKISKERGRFRFIKQVTTEKGVTWIDVWGGPKGSEAIRSFYPDRIKTVHSKNKTDYHLAKEYKEKQKAKKSESE
jgi:hypothetical protein